MSIKSYNTTDMIGPGVPAIHSLKVGILSEFKIYYIIAVKSSIF